MKRLALFLILAACAETVERSPGAENLVPFDDEPVGCVLLYRLSVEAEVRNQNEAVWFLEDKILEQQRQGNAYWITSIRSAPGRGGFASIGNAYAISANVYKCPDHARFVTKSDIEKASDYQSRR